MRKRKWKAEERNTVRHFDANESTENTDKHRQSQSSTFSTSDNISNSPATTTAAAAVDAAAALLLLLLLLRDFPKLSFLFFRRPFILTVPAVGLYLCINILFHLVDCLLLSVGSVDIPLKIIPFHSFDLMSIDCLEIGWWTYLKLDPTKWHRDTFCHSC